MTESATPSRLGMHRTNIYLDEDQLRALKHLAAEEHRSAADLVRQALHEFIRKRGAEQGESRAGLAEALEASVSTFPRTLRPTRSRQTSPQLENREGPCIVLRAVVDTNVWVSAAIDPAGRPASILAAAMDARFQYLTSAPLIAGLEEVR